MYAPRRSTSELAPEKLETFTLKQERLGLVGVQRQLQYISTTNTKHLCLQRDINPVALFPLSMFLFILRGTTNLRQKYAIHAYIIN